MDVAKIHCEDKDSEVPLYQYEEPKYEDITRITGTKKSLLPVTQASLWTCMSGQCYQTTRNDRRRCTSEGRVLCRKDYIKCNSFI